MLQRNSEEAPPPAADAPPAADDPPWWKRMARRNPGEDRTPSPLTFATDEPPWWKRAGTSLGAAGRSVAESARKLGQRDGGSAWAVLYRLQADEAKLAPSPKRAEVVALVRSYQAAGRRLSALGEHERASDVINVLLPALLERPEVAAVLSQPGGAVEDAEEAAAAAAEVAADAAAAIFADAAAAAPAAAGRHRRRRHRRRPSPRPSPSPSPSRWPSPSFSICASPRRLPLR